MTAAHHLKVIGLNIAHMRSPRQFDEFIWRNAKHTLRLVSYWPRAADEHLAEFIQKLT